jgi:hypothetical protein
MAVTDIEILNPRRQGKLQIFSPGWFSHGAMSIWCPSHIPSVCLCDGHPLLASWIYFTYTVINFTEQRPSESRLLNKFTPIMEPDVHKSPTLASTCVILTQTAPVTGLHLLIYPRFSTVYTESCNFLCGPTPNKGIAGAFSLSDYCCSGWSLFVHLSVRTAFASFLIHYFFAGRCLSDSPAEMFLYIPLPFDKKKHDFVILCGESISYQRCKG